MGASVSTNVAKTTKEITNNITNNQANIARAEATQKSSLNISGNKCGGDMRISGVRVGNQARIDLKQTAMGMTDTSIQSQMSAQLKAAATAANEDLNLLQLSVATNVTEDVQKSTTNISNSVRNECGGKLDQTAEFNITDNKILGDCEFEDIEVLNKGELKVDCVQSAVANSSAINEAQSKIDQAATASNKGIDPTIMMIAMAVVIIVFIIAVAYTFPKILEVTAGKDSAAGKLLAIPALSGIAGIVFVILFVLVKEDTSQMRRSAFTTMCPGAKGSTGAGPYSNADQAVDACRDDPLCKAMQFNAGITTFFTQDPPTDCKPQSTTPAGVKAACDKCKKAKPCGGDKECPGCYCDVKTGWEVDQFGDVEKRQGPAEERFCGKKWCDGSSLQPCAEGETLHMRNSGECGKPTVNENGTLEYKPCCKCRDYERKEYCLEKPDRIACARCNMGMSEHVCSTSEDPSDIEKYFDCTGSALYDCVMNGRGCEACGVKDEPEGTVPCGFGVKQPGLKNMRAMAIKREEKTPRVAFLYFAVFFMVVAMISGIVISGKKKT